VRKSWVSHKDHLLFNSLINPKKLIILHGRIFAHFLSSLLVSVIYYKQKVQSYILERKTTPIPWNVIWNFTFAVPAKCLTGLTVYLDKWNSEVVSIWCILTKTNLTLKPRYRRYVTLNSRTLTSSFLDSYAAV